jgi:hypothetical protein
MVFIVVPMIEEIPLCNLRQRLLPIYRNLMKSIGKQLEEKRAFTFTINTDGISKSDKSKCTIWPVFLTINELPLDQRFSLENTVVAGKVSKVSKIYLQKI